MTNKTVSSIHPWLVWLALACGLLAQPAVWAATCTSTGGNWATAGTWANCGGVTPQVGDTVVINSGTVTLNTSASIAGLTLNGGTLAIGNNATARTLTVNGNIVVASGATLNVNNNTVLHTLNVAGNITNNGTFDLARDANSYCTANFTGAAAQTISGSSTGVTDFYNVTASSDLIINKSGAAITQTGTLTANGNLIVQAGTYNLANTTTVNGTTSISGTLGFTTTTGSRTFVGAVTVNSGGIWSNTANESVTFRGGLTHNGSTFTAGTGVYTFDTNAQAIGGSSALAIPSVTVTGVTLTQTGTLTVATALSGTGGLTNDTNATLNLGGTSAITTLTASATGNTVNYTGAAQTVKPTTYHHLGLSGTNAKTMAGVTTINGNLSLSGTATAISTANLSIGGNLNVGAGTSFTSGNTTFSVLGTTSVSGTLAHSVSGSKTYVGAVTINSGGVWTNAANSPVILRGGLTHNGSTFTAGTGVYTFDTNAQAIGGSSALAIPSVTVTGVTLTQTGTMTVATALSGTGGLTNDTNATLNLGGTSAITTLTASATGNTVNYTQAGPQTVKTTSYVNLGCSGSGVKSLAGDVAVNGTLTLSGATLAVGTHTLTLNGPTIAGTPANLSTTTASSLVFGGSSTGVSVPASVTALNNLTVNNASGVTLGSSLTLNGTLTLSSGVITTGANTLTLAAFCPGSASRANGHVNGNLTLAFPTGNPTCTFHVGDSIGYAPVTVAMTGVTVAGRLAGRVDAGDHPDTTNSISGIEASKSANHYWTLTAGTPAPSYGSYAATFQFCASTASCVTPSEVDVGAATGNFMVARKSGSSWSMPTVGARTAYSTQATGITSVDGFGVFAVGEVSLCFTDAFTGVDGSSPGSNWSVNTLSGSFGNPVIVGNRLRLTDATTAVATWATLLRPIPAYGNKVVVEFDYYAYGGSGGDGMAVVLSDGAVAPVAGAFGGSLGYAQKSNPGSDCTVVGGCPGFAGGWLGIGLDAYGNYSTSAEGRNGGAASLVPDGVAVRGSGSGVSGYRFLQGTASLSPGVDGAFSPAHRYRITMDHTNGVNAFTSVERDTGSGYVSLIAPFDVKDPGYSQSLVPTMFNLSFTGATGTSTNINEIDNLKVCSVQALVAPTLNHIRLEHGGSACSGSAATVTVKACADAACSSLYNGSVTVNLTATAGTWNTSPVTFTGQTDVTLTYGAAGSVTLGGTATSPTTGNATRCFNGASETCTLTYSACSVDVVEVGAALGAPIYTKLAGVPFNLDVVRFSGNQTVNIIQLVNASSGTCSTYPTLGSTTTTLPLTLNNTTPRRTVAFTYNDAVANARVRVTNSGGVVSCSSDNFAIRPQAFVVTSSATNTGSSGTPVFRAGADPFSVTATAVYGATTTPGYVAAPKFNASLVTTSQAQLGALTATTFPVAADGVSSASGFKYGEVGNFNLGQYAVYDDAFAAVDAVKGECTTGFSNALDGNGKYSCQFGSAAAGPFGRFVPNHFTVTPSVANACAAGSFTYLGQPFKLSTASVVEARNAGNAITVNYAGVFAPGVVTFAAENADSGTDLGASLVFSGVNDQEAISGDWQGGVFILKQGATVVKFTRPTTPVGPFDELHIGVAVDDGDPDIVVPVVGVDMNPVSVGGSPTHKELAGSPLRMRYGRLRLLNAYGSERLPLPLAWETQYWSGQSFIRHTQDSCTTLAAANIALSNYQSPPNPGGTVLGPGNLSAVAVGAINAGRGTITLAPTAAAIGSVDLVANLGSPSNNCAGLPNGTSTSAGLAYLSGQWCGAANDRDPTARASFGVYKSPLIYRRENY